MGQASSQTPPVGDDFPRVGRSRETEIRRDALGRWFNGEVRITHPKLARSFDRWLKPADNGRFMLENEINWAYVSVEGPICFVRRVMIDEAGARLELSNGQTEALRVRTLRQGPSGALYCGVGGGVARFDRQAVHELADLLGQDEVGVYVETAGVRVHVPVVLNPLEDIVPT